MVVPFLFSLFKNCSLAPGECSLTDATGTRLATCPDGFKDAGIRTKGTSRNGYAAGGEQESMVVLKGICCAVATRLLFWQARRGREVDVVVVW